MTTILILPNHIMLEKVWGKQVPTSVEKGYPNCFSDMCFWVLLEDGNPIAYTASKGYEKFTLVGNTYVKRAYRKQGSHSKLLKERNKRIRGVKVTVLNPIEESHMDHLAKVVTRLGYIRIECYHDAEDIMTKEFYDEISRQPSQQVWRKGSAET